jgi:hypothetical protein
MSRKKPGFDNFFDLGKGKNRYIALSREIADSLLWRSLSKSAQLGYINILVNYNGTNSHEIICPRSNMMCKMSSRGWFLATEELKEAGFIKVLRRSGINKLPNIYSLCNDWKRKERELYNKK